MQSTPSQFMHILEEVKLVKEVFPEWCLYQQEVCTCYGQIDKDSVRRKVTLPTRGMYSTPSWFMLNLVKLVEQVSPE